MIKKSEFRTMQKEHVISRCIKVCCSLLFAFIFSHVNATELRSPEHEQWLKDKFGAQHQQLIPVVAVTNMFVECNKQRQYISQNYSVKEVLKNVNRDDLAIQLAGCLGDDDIKSEQALNFGLKSCFNEQLAHLPQTEREQKMKLVNAAIGSLSRSERQKSFTQCVTEQAINYLE